MREDGFLLLLDSPCSDSVKLGKNNVEWKMDKIANILWKLAEAGQSFECAATHALIDFKTLHIRYSTVIQSLNGSMTR